MLQTILLRVSNFAPGALAGWLWQASGPTGDDDDDTEVDVGGEGAHEAR